MEDLQNLEPWKERNWNGDEVTVGIPKPFDIRTAIESNPSMGISLDLERAVQQIQKEIVEKVDAACRVAREKGCGVKVTTYIDDGKMLIEVTDKVPAGEIHHFDSPAPFKPLS